MSKVKVYRQGDVILVPVNVDISGAEEVKSRIEGKTILAEGEVTGHFHSIPASTSKQFRLSGAEYVKLNQPSTLTHDEHAPINLPAGTYQKIIAREYDQVAKLSRRVVD